MTTPDNPEGTDPTRGSGAEQDRQRTDPTGGVSARDPSRLPPDPTEPREPDRDTPAAEEEDPEASPGS
jgi:hypothetical protein